MSAIGTTKYVMDRLLAVLPIQLEEREILLERFDCYSFGFVIDGEVDEKALWWVKRTVRDSLPIWATVSHVEAWPWREWKGTEREAAIVAARALDPDSVFELVRSMR